MKFNSKVLPEIPILSTHNVFYSCLVPRVQNNKVHDNDYSRFSELL